MNVYDIICVMSHVYTQCGSLMIDLVLRTDMSKHFVALKDFKELADTNSSDPCAWKQGLSLSPPLSLSSAFSPFYTTLSRRHTHTRETGCVSVGLSVCLSHAFLLP